MWYTRRMTWNSDVTLQLFLITIFFGIFVAGLFKIVFSNAGGWAYVAVFAGFLGAFFSAWWTDDIEERVTQETLASVLATKYEVTLEGLNELGQIKPNTTLENQSIVTADGQRKLCTIVTGDLPGNLTVECVEGKVTPLPVVD